LDIAIGKGGFRQKLCNIRVNNEEVIFVAAVDGIPDGNFMDT